MQRAAVAESQGPEMLAPVSDGRPALLRLVGVGKSYGETQANKDLTFEVQPGEVVGLLGANGAGKSTLIKILSGVVELDAGRLEFDGQPVEVSSWSPGRTRNEGIRIVHQELSLCTNLTVYENFYLETPNLAKGFRGLSRKLKELAERSIEAVFPIGGIDCRKPVHDLTLAQRQMVEIARAASDPKLRILILDEPTSSLGGQHAAELAAFVRSLSGKGVAIIYISHKLTEVVDLVSRVLVMRNGSLIWQGPIAETNVDHLVGLMGGLREAARADHRSEGNSGSKAAPVLITIAADSDINGLGRPLELRAGEVVGVAGLEGSGQRLALRLLHFGHTQRTAFVAGDRGLEGIFPGGSVLENASTSYIAERGLTAIISDDEIRRIAFPWFERLRLPTARATHPVTELSGGNQQKTLMARALATDNEVILLDDPTRGVDVGVKAEFYDIIRQAANSGRLVVWNSTEDAEFAECDRVLVFRNGVIAQEFEDAPGEETLVASFFDRATTTHAQRARKSKRSWLQVNRYLAPISLILMFAISFGLNHGVASRAGLDLLLSGSVALVLASLAQMFVVGGSQIDLGLGSFVGLTSVLVATLLVDNPTLGVFALVVALLAYAGSALLIELCRVPSIVATLGLSFVWTGVGYLLQPLPGGSSPEWLTTILNYEPPIIPTSLLIILVFGALAAWFNASRLGIVLRGFGSNRTAMVQAGWSPLKFQLLRYLVSGVLATASGMLLTGTNTASDINISAPLTLLGIAALVMGGCSLIGGVIAPFGTLCGALTLSLVTIVLGLVQIGTDFSPMIQGGLLIGILLIRSVSKSGGDR